MGLLGLKQCCEVSEKLRYKIDQVCHVVWNTRRMFFSLWKRSRKIVLFRAVIFGEFFLTRDSPVSSVFIEMENLFSKFLWSQKSLWQRPIAAAAVRMKRWWVPVTPGDRVLFIFIEPLSPSLSLSSTFPLPLSIFFFKFQALVSLNRSFPHSLTANNRPVTAIPPLRN